MLRLVMSFYPTLPPPGPAFHVCGTGARNHSCVCLRLRLQKRVRSAVLAPGETTGPGCLEAVFLSCLETEALEASAPVDTQQITFTVVPGERLS